MLNSSLDSLNKQIVINIKLTFKTTIYSSKLKFSLLNIWFTRCNIIWFSGYISLSVQFNLLQLRLKKTISFVKIVTTYLYKITYKHIGINKSILYSLNSFYNKLNK